MDAFGHVNNANYITYIEDARITFIKRWNLCNETRSIIIASMRIDYFKQVDIIHRILLWERGLYV